MIRCRPTITYPLGIILIIWVLLGAIVFPNANHWLKGTSSSIEQDTMSFDLNRPIQNRNALFETSEHKSYRDHVFSMLNAPSVSLYGTRGVLYHQRDACQHSNESYSVPTVLNQPSFSELAKIALIENNQACRLTDKIILAQNNGAAATIVFSPNYEEDLSNISSHLSFSEQDVTSNQVQIPSYFVDLNIGMSLLRDVYRLHRQEPRQGYSQFVVRVRLVAGRPPDLDHWQFGLVIVGIMLFSCVVAMTILHCHLWHIRRSRQQINSSQEVLTLEEQQLMNETNQQLWRYLNTPTKQRTRHRLDQHVVDMLPLRTFKTKDPNHQGCIICLDGFEKGQELRQLPCSHEYHRDCIDKWLTKKNNTCPLCLHRIELPAVPEQAYTTSTTPDLADTWHHLEQSALNQHYSKSSRP